MSYVGLVKGSISDVEKNVESQTVPVIHTRSRDFLLRRVTKPVTPIRNGETNIFGKLESVIDIRQDDRGLIWSPGIPLWL